MRIRRQSGIVLVSFFGAIAVVAFSAPPMVGADETLEKALQTSRKQRQTEAAAVREVIARLNLNDQQVRQLLALAAEAAKLHVEAYQTEARLQPEMLKVFAEFAREDSLDQGFSPPVEQHTARLIHESKTTDERITARLIDLEKQAKAILTPQQQLLIQESALPKKPPRKAKAAAAPDQRPELLRGRAARRAAAAQQAGERDPLVLARRAMESLHRQIHPELGPIGQNLLHPVAAVALCQKLGTVENQDVREAAEIFDHGTTDYPMSKCIADKAKLAVIRAEISNWNLINGLHLNGRQIGQIVALYGAAQIETAPLSQPAIKKPRRDTERQRETRVQLEHAVEQVLNPGQQQVLSEFKPCLIPPKNLKDPVRVGQANDHSQQENWLSRARRMPEPQLRRSIDNVLTAEAKHFGELNEKDRAARVALLIDVAQEAAKMTDVEFEINKAELAEKITPPDRIMQLKERIAAISRERSLPSTISQFMLNPGFIDQLRTRGQQLAKGAADKAAGPTAKVERPGKAE
jgi:hypothetical protein